MELPCLTQADIAALQLQDDTGQGEHRDSNRLDELGAVLPPDSYATMSELSNPSLGISVLDNPPDRHQPYVSAAEFWQGAEAPPTGGAPPRGYSVASNVPTLHPYEMQPPNEQVYTPACAPHQQVLGAPFTQHTQVEAPIPAAQDLLNSRNPDVMRLVDALRSQLQQGIQQPPPPMNPQPSLAYVSAMQAANAPVPPLMHPSHQTVSAPSLATPMGHIQAGPSRSEPVNIPQGAIQQTRTACSHQPMPTHHHQQQPQVWAALEMYGPLLQPNCRCRFTQ